MRTSATVSFKPSVRVTLATAVLVIAAGLAQTAHASPHGMGMHGAQGGHGGQGGHGMGLMGHPEHMVRMFESVGASAEQRAQIKAIMQVARADMKAHRDRGKELRQQNQALFTQPNVDARAAEALRQQTLAQHDQASKRMLQAQLDVSRVLSPEQRQQLAERMNQRRGMMERHRAERDGLMKRGN